MTGMEPIATTRKTAAQEPPGHEVHGDWEFQFTGGTLVMNACMFMNRLYPMARRVALSGERGCMRDEPQTMETRMRRGFLPGATAVRGAIH